MRPALGFRMHTGWAAVVAVSGKPPNFRLLLRERLELLPGDGSIPRFVYHAAAERSLDEAAELVASAIDAARASARRALSLVLKATDAPIECAGVPGGSTKIPPQLETILAAHPLIHAAEGTLFQRAVVSACEELGIKVIAAREREIWSNAAAAIGMDEAKFRTVIDGLRKDFGPPWSADQKIAASAAILAGSARK